MFEAGAQKGGLAGAVDQMLDVGVEQQQVGLRESLWPVPADATGELDDGAHRRGFDDGPVVVVIPADLGNRRRQDDENMVRLGVPVEWLAQFGVGKQGSGVVALEQAIQSLLDVRAHQQRVARVIDAQMNALAGGGATGKQAAGDQDQRIDVGHADQAEADAFAADRVGLMIGGMQAGNGGLQRLGEIGADLFATGAGNGQRQDVGVATHRGLAQAGQALFDKAGMRGAVTADFAVVGGFRAEFVKPGTADGGRSVRLTAMLGEFRSSGAIGLEQPFDQSRRQGGGGKQHAAAEQAGPVDEAAEGGQVFDAEVIRLVENQIAGHEPQHGRYLMAAACALAGRHQVIDGAGEQRRVDQLGGRRALL